MVRQGRHSRHSSACSSDYDLSDGDEELGCCAATARRLCCCACCGVGAFQAGGHGLSPPEGDLQDGRAGSGSCGSSLCCGLFGCCQREQELPKASRDVLAAKREEILELEGKIREEQAKVRGQSCSTTCATPACVQTCGSVLALLPSCCSMHVTTWVCQPAYLQAVP